MVRLFSVLFGQKMPHRTGRDLNLSTHKETCAKSGSSGDVCQKVGSEGTAVVSLARLKDLEAGVVIESQIRNVQIL